MRTQSAKDYVHEDISIQNGPEHISILEAVLYQIWFKLISD